MTIGKSVRRGPGRPRAEPGRDLRRDLLAISRRLLDEGGPAALSLREVARRAGCTHQAPYHYFADRESILAALVAEGFEELARGLHEANDIAPVRGVRAALLASGHAYLGFALSRPGVFRIMFRPDVCNPARFPDVLQAGERARAELDRLNLIVHGEGAPPELATVLWSHVHGLSCLLVDGPLAMQFGSEGERAGFLDGVGAAFADRILAALPDPPADEPSLR